jgi:probable phosphoglycerate mutase
VADRVAAWLAELPPEPDRRVIAVSHGVTGRVLRGLYASLDRDRAAIQDVPQDAVFLLQHGGVGRIDCEAVE